MTFEKQVKIALIKKEWTQRRLAEELGISRVYLYEVLKYPKSPQLRKQIKEILADEWN